MSSHEPRAYFLRRGLEADKATVAALEGKKYTYNDLGDFVTGKLFPYLHGFKQKASGPNTIEYKIGEIFGEMKTRSRAATTCAKSLRCNLNDRARCDFISEGMRKVQCA